MPDALYDFATSTPVDVDPWAIASLALRERGYRALPTSSPDHFAAVKAGAVCAVGTWIELKSWLRAGEPRALALPAWARPRGFKLRGAVVAGKVRVVGRSVRAA